MDLGSNRILSKINGSMKTQLKLSGSSHGKVSQRFNTVARIGIIFVMDLAMGGTSLTLANRQNLNIHVFRITEYRN